jgi:DNA ligase-1
MLALKWKDYKDKANAFPLWTQPKLDGMRSTTYGEELTSRNNKPIVSAPHILEDLVPFFENHAVRLDGELYNHDLKHDFDRVMSLCKKKNPTTIELIESKDAVQYHVYDLPDHPGTFSERYAALVELSKDFPACVKLVDTRLVHDIDELDKVYADWIEDGYEGQMIRLDEVYLPGDKRDWRLMKRKEFIDAEFEVDDIQQGRGNWAGIAKRAVLKLPDGRKFEAGIKGNMIAGKKLLEEHAAGITPKECTLRFQNYTPDGIPRFGVVYHWWMNGRANDE